jgi:hypothetical protein
MLHTIVIMLYAGAFEYEFVLVFFFIFGKLPYLSNARERARRPKMGV